LTDILVVDYMALKIRTMEKGDVELCVNLFNIAGWGNTKSDAFRMLQFSPGGCFIASFDDVNLGMVSSTGYGNQGWIGNLIVHPEYRGRGFGATLMEKAINHLNKQGVKSIRLDSVPLAVNLYKRLGFRPEFNSLRFIGEGKDCPEKYAEPMMLKDLETVARLDESYFGSSRKRMLGRILEEFPELCYTVRDDSQLMGYIMGKRGTEINRIGPWICDPDRPELAEGLLKQLMSKLDGEKLWIGVPEENTASVHILVRNGFQQQPSSQRMCRGECNTLGNVNGRFSIGAPDKG
jgi:ribosomal protein S18 acetylase RimI-like enzyme